MPPRKSLLPRAEAEAALLRFLCNATSDRAVRIGLEQLLCGYRWVSADHTILFECISDLLAHEPRQILEHLPAALTRRGFPDISCDFLHEPCELDAAPALALAEELLRAS